MTSLNRLAHQALALALLAAVLLAGYVFIVDPLAARYTNARDQIAEQRILLGRLSLAADQQGLTRTLGQRDEASASEPVFLSGGSDAVKVASLQSLLAGVAEAEGVTLKSTRAAEPREREAIRFVGVEAHVTATVEQLQRMLLTLEAQRPHIFVESLHIAPLAASRPDTGADEAGLDVRLAIHGAAERTKG